MPEAVKGIFENEAVAINSGQSGLGLTLVKEMGELVHASFTIVENVPKGTVVTVAFSDWA
jgi:hypothetical protein